VGGVGLRRSQPVHTVSELAARIKGAVDDFGTVWVSGEISGCKRAGPGNLYFCLKDDSAQLDAVMFRKDVAQLAFTPVDGTEVVVLGQASFWPERGRLQFLARHMEPLGLGALRLAFEQLKARLQAEGLFDTARKRPLPRVPRTIGIVTALAGAARHDMLRVLRDRWPAARVLVRPVRVQGPGAAAEIADAIADLQRGKTIDVVIVGRGGGSLEDLWAFNEEPVARAIAGCRVPIVSAVGHESDVTIADFAADVRAPTPTAAAALVVPDRRELASQVRQAVHRLRGGLHRQVRTAAARLEGYERRLGDPRRRVADVALKIDDLHLRARRALVRRALWDRRELRRLAAELARHGPGEILAANRARVLRDAERLRRTMERRLDGLRANLRHEAARLDAFSPLACLERGYAIVRRDDPTAAVVRDADTLRAGDAIRIVLAHGRARAHVDSTEK
jgi:exodeoxyribonuclease VII large subunit